MHIYELSKILLDPSINVEIVSKSEFKPFLYTKMCPQTNDNPTGGIYIPDATICEYKNSYESNVYCSCMLKYIYELLLKRKIILKGELQNPGRKVWVFWLLLIG